MKTIVILLADYRCLHIFDKCFAGKSSFDLSTQWAKKVGDETFVIALKNDSDFVSNIEAQKNVVLLDSFDVLSLISTIYEIASKNKADSVIYSYADLPFLNEKLTREIIETHYKYQAEYTFADGFPYGLSPEIINTDTVAILKELLSTTQEEHGKRIINRTSLFDLIKTDINSFEIETVISDDDWRLFRISFDCGSKASKKACCSIYNEKINEMNANDLSKTASENENVLKTLPAFYNIQISEKSTYNSLYEPNCMQSKNVNNFMKKEDFSEIVKKISEFSENAIISLSAFGEALYNPNFVDFIKIILEYTGLKVVVETDGQNISRKLCEDVKKIVEESKERTGYSDYFDKIIWIVKIDSFSSELYKKIHDNYDGFNNAIDAVSVLSEFFPSNVYPQFVRMEQNENELEQFYRFWNDKNNISKGKFIIQKYSNYCGKLVDYKPADLSPLERNVCWHLRRDLTILVNGDIPLCHESLKDCIIANVFKDSFDDIWNKLTIEVKNQMKNIYCEKCERCDEYYTFNF